MSNCGLVVKVFDSGLECSGLNPYSRHVTVNSELPLVILVLLSESISTLHLLGRTSTQIVEQVLPEAIQS